MRLHPIRLIAAAGLLAAAPAFAQDGDPAPPTISPEIATGGDSITILGGVATVPSYEGSDSQQIIPAATVRGTISGYSFSTRGTKVFADLAKDDDGPVWNFELGPVVGVNLNRVTAIGDSQVRALGKRKLAVEAGGYIGIGKTGVLTSDFDTLSASVSFVHDVTGVYKSFVVTPQLDYGTPLSRFAYVGVSASASYAGEGYADTYFRVNTAGAARSGLPVYNPGAGWKNWSVGLLGVHALTGDLRGGLAVGGAISYSRLLNDFADSPVTSIAGSRNQVMAALGLAYTF